MKLVTNWLFRSKISRQTNVHIRMNGSPSGWCRHENRPQRILFSSTNGGSSRLRDFACPVISSARILRARTCRRHTDPTGTR